MCEESACLVPPLEPTQNGPSESRPSFSVSSGSGGVAHNGEALVGFHEDALSQAAMGKAQLLLAIVLGLGLAAECSELTILNYILPAAELHLCIDEHRKGWLVSITLLAMAGGSFAWGILGDHLGRRRALISALSVAGLFSAVAAVMPTYGTFMTARFCSGLGISGAFPLSFSYLTETCSRATRSRYSGILHSLWPLGAVFTSIISYVTMPSQGADIVQDNREHWSSWHKFLILSILPIIACIIGLMWASESPRYLLEASREVEALAVYQRLHRLNKARTQYGLTELELPGRSAYRERPASPSRNIFSHGLNSFREALQRISSPMHFRTTLLLAVLHLLLGFTYMGVSTFSWSYIKQLRDQEYKSSRQFVENATYTGLTMNSTIENVQYKNSVFRNMSFTHMSLNHVEFLNCTIDETEFMNVKASVSRFEDSVIKNCRFVDTDITEHNFINSILINNTFMAVISDCFVDFDFNIYMDDLYDETIAWSGTMFPVLFLLGFIIETVTRPPVIISLLLLAGIAGAGIFFLTTSVIVETIEVLIKIFLMCAVSVVTLVVVEAYPCHLRCTAHGLLRSLFHLASLCAIPIYNMLLHTILLFPAVITVSLTLFAALLSYRIQDNSKVLL
ncbi:synaptic vesicle glycoprotein 2B-like isoform X2 [Aethina tumida]|uniref:synaptic vesicle glycoprotein 2B-like isoform X2 n=1 Tax=Aethina tumida TaxID=116153 RepID=UPI002148C733|nr:synaptic vesicle glycoprotein 2B-like isoform X2 [Aethina tumida]XP_049817895.1 synaptic vesicle glycoprotein 2B-like isoform X2 [Aethina tumida]